MRRANPYSEVSKSRLEEETRGESIRSTLMKETGRKKKGYKKSKHNALDDRYGPNKRRRGVRVD